MFCCLCQHNCIPLHHFSETLLPPPWPKPPSSLPWVISIQPHTWTSDSHTSSLTAHSPLNSCNETLEHYPNPITFWSTPPPPKCRKAPGKSHKLLALQVLFDLPPAASPSIGVTRQNRGGSSCYSNCGSHTSTGAIQHMRNIDTQVPSQTDWELAF